MIGLRSDDDIDHRLPANDFLALGLSHASGDNDLQGGILGPHSLEPPELGVDLFGGLLPDMACVQEHEIRFFTRLGHAVPGHSQRIRHASAVVDVHLASICTDVRFLRRLHRFSIPRQFKVSVVYPNKRSETRRVDPCETMTLSEFSVCGTMDCIRDCICHSTK